MLLPFALAVALAVGSASAQQPPVAPAAVESSAPVAAEVPPPPPVAAGEPDAETAVARAKAKAREQRRRTNRLLLGLAGLLGLWLLARSQIRARALEVEGQVAHKAPPRRRLALNHDELGHLVFEAARGRNYHDFRDLFLNGPEAANLLGAEGAQAYLEQRSDLVLHRVLDELADTIEQGAVYVGVVPVEGGQLGLRVRHANGLEGVWPVCLVTRIETGCRIYLPTGEGATVAASG